MELFISLLLLLARGSHLAGARTPLAGARSPVARAQTCLAGARTRGERTNPPAGLRSPAQAGAAAPAFPRDHVHMIPRGCGASGPEVAAAGHALATAMADKTSISQPPPPHAQLSTIPFGPIPAL